jgi:hypothetical protein
VNKHQREAAAAKRDAMMAGDDLARIAGEMGEGSRGFSPGILRVHARAWTLARERLALAVDAMLDAARRERGR